MTDTVKAWIEQRRVIHSKGTDVLLRNAYELDREAELCGADAEAIVDAHNMFPRALDALSKVLERHQPIDGLAYDSPPQECNVCADDRGPRPWPCPTVQAIEGAINHE